MNLKTRFYFICVYYVTETTKNNYFYTVPTAILFGHKSIVK